ncbi:MAG: hypothetical protein OHK0046_23320 [Anaerolineae bacterium]
MLFSVGVFLRMHAIIDHTLIDDAYITYRYAANLARGEGLVYNVGERVLGTTTPGYAVLLGTGGALLGTEQIPRLSTGLNMVAILALAVVVIAIAYRLTHVPLVAALAGAVMLLEPTTTQTSIAGMEVSVFLLLVALAVLALIMERWRVAALIAGLSPLFRPEGVFLVGLLGIHLLLLWRWGTWSLRRMLAVGTILVLPGMLAALLMTLYYGSPIPQSIVAKQAGLYPIPVQDTLAEVLAYLDTLFNTTAVLPANPEAFEWIGQAWPVLLALAVTVIGSGAWFVQRHRALWIIPAFLLILILFIGTSETLIFPHYFALFAALTVLCWWIGLYALGAAVLHGLRQASRRGMMPLLLSVSLTVSAVIALLPQWDRIAWETVETGSVELSNADKRLVAYRDLAKALAPLLPPDTVIAMPEIGELGFFLPDVNVMDTAGLVTPAATAYFPVAPEDRIDERFGAVPPQMIKDLQPELLITLDSFLLRGLSDDPWLWEHYTAVVEIRGDWLPWFGSVIYVLARNDVAPQLDLSAVAQRFASYSL